MRKNLFQAIGHTIGKKAAQARNAFDLVSGTDEESVQAEIRLGRDMAAAVLARTPLVEDNETTRFTIQIGQWLSAHLKDKKIPFAIRTTADLEPNALAIPGGHIFISWGLLDICRGERDRIGFVIAHEMAHIVERHTLDRILKDAAVSLLLRQAPGTHAAGAWLGQTGKQLLNRAFSRDDEFEADLFAADLLRKAGGDPEEGERLLMKVASLTQQDTTGAVWEYFSSHPSLQERIANLRQRRISDHP
jgi:predicted Zn-dependent protease